MNAPARDEEIAADDPRRPLDPRDYSRRTLLADERTFLAWWRTGLTSLTVAIAAARVVPELSGSKTTWPYLVLGTVFALLGVLCMVYGEHRRAAVSKAVRRGEFAEVNRAISLIITTTGALLGLATVALILVDP